jgi:hypothetical protein
VLIPRNIHEQLFLEALDYVGLDERCIVLFLVPGPHPQNGPGIAYLPPPDPDQLDYVVFQRVGLDRLYEYRQQHRFAAFRKIDDAPLGAIGTELCHEARHGVQFDAYGPHFIEIDQILRRTLPNDPALYRQIPMEYDANRVAARFAGERYAGEVQAMAADARFEQYTLDYDAGERNLLDATTAMLWQHADPQTPDRDGQTLEEVVADLADGVRQWQANRNQPWAHCVARGAAQPRVVAVPSERRARAEVLSKLKLRLRKLRRAWGR